MPDICCIDDFQIDNLPNTDLLNRRPAGLAGLPKSAICETDGHLNRWPLIRGMICKMFVSSLDGLSAGK
jgi:hypothetical protein